MNKPVIICIDDELTVLSSLKRGLKVELGDDYHVETALGGIDALELIEDLIEEGSQIVLVISDYIMPDIKGDEVLKRIHDISPKTLKIMLTGQATLDGVTNAINSAQLYRYIAKPWHNADLNLTVREALKSYLQEEVLEAQNTRLLQMNRELEQLNQAFLRFVPRQFLQFLEKSSIVDVQLGDQVEKEMSVLFSDIRAFTSLSEKMTPEDNFKFINAYLSRMEPAILKNRGFIDKYIGDAIMALFGSSMDADDALQAGITMLRTLAEYNLTRSSPERPPLKIGIGINTGSLMLGTVGGSAQMTGTVISDAVNLASRLETLTKEYGVSLLISQEAFFHLKDSNEYAMRIIDRVRVKGKSDLVSVFEVFEADSELVRERKLATKTLFERSIVFYHMGKLEAATQGFSSCCYQNPGDAVARIYLKRCRLKSTPHLESASSR
ncbi:MAG: adenylate/guanylate cyclase domain-containing protein [Cyanobacteriota bacterium]|nr:adenylate/guanylate cyclase domain-containing protein [Cyanobacteriota bacterium]